MLLRGTIAGLLGATALMVAAPAAGATRNGPVDIRPGPLTSALRELARETGLELLFDEEMVTGLTSRGLRGAITPEQALQLLLSGTGRTARRAASGAFVVERAATAAADEEVVVAEVLVIGRRTQNVDIPRRERDVQPYAVSTGEQILRAHRDNLGQFFGSRITQNAQVLAPSLLEEGRTNSQVDLRGLGADRTLVLLDGRRLPSLPDALPATFEMEQPDLNAIPLHAIERVETLTGTAGGIYGFGALGGVVNVVLKRNYRGAELHSVAGITSRGDARRLGVEGHLGFTPDDGRTDVMLHVSRSLTEPLLVGERSYLAQDRQRAFALAPTSVANSLPLGNAVTVVTFADDVRFKPEFGGGALGAGFTHLPIGFSGTPAELRASLVQNAGQLDLGLAEDEARSEIGSHSETTAAILNIRRRFDGGLEAFADVTLLRNEGSHRRHEARGLLFLPASSPKNPFEDTIFLTFPVTGNDRHKTSSFQTARYTAGIIAPLPYAWRGTAEVTFGEVEASTGGRNEGYYTDPLYFFIGGAYGPDLNPLGDWQEFQRGTEAYRGSTRSRFDVGNEYSEQALRLAGPLFRREAGLTTLTVLLEHRREKVPAYTGTGRGGSTGGPITLDYVVPERASDTVSAYAELRSPVYGDEAPIRLLRALELQLAVRHDSRELEFSANPVNPAIGSLQHRFADTAFTVGAKASPARWLTVRGSYATGGETPLLSDLISQEAVDPFPFVADPKRGDTYLFLEGPALMKSGGSPDLKPVEASTVSVGAVLSPRGDNGPRLALDYSRIETEGETYRLLADTVLQHEERWPERVAREPLSEADRALGYTGGRITMIDSRAMNGAARVVEAVDARAEWPMQVLNGRLRAYGAATLQMRNGEKGLLEPEVERAGYNTGPLKWRTNVGADWTDGSTTIGANVQHYGSHRIYSPGFPAVVEEMVAAYQGSHWVSAQTYVDLYASRRFRVDAAGARREVTLDVGLVNALDASPPRETIFALGAPGYSRYGDPRRRRFELRLSAYF